MRTYSRGAAVLLRMPFHTGVAADIMPIAEAGNA